MSPVVSSWLSTKVRLCWADNVAVWDVTFLATTSPFSTGRPEFASTACPVPLTTTPVS
jgi:hypothetical protein